MRYEFGGRVFSGMGRGRYYVGHPEYQKRFEVLLGYRPYPGTLNVKLEDEGEVQKMRSLRSGNGRRLEGFVASGESMSAVACFKGELGGEEVAVLSIEVTHYNDTVAELISPTYLRGKLGIVDGEAVLFTAETLD
jgi:riboflavin kinase, archaea type